MNHYLLFFKNFLLFSLATLKKGSFKEVMSAVSCEVNVVPLSQWLPDWLTMKPITILSGGKTVVFQDWQQGCGNTIKRHWSRDRWQLLQGEARVQTQAAPEITLRSHWGQPQWWKSPVIFQVLFLCTTLILPLMFLNLSWWLQDLLKGKTGITPWNI